MSYTLKEKVACLVLKKVILNTMYWYRTQQSTTFWYNLHDALSAVERNCSPSSALEDAREAFHPCDPLEEIPREAIQSSGQTYLKKAFYTDYLGPSSFNEIAQVFQSSRGAYFEDLEIGRLIDLLPDVLKTWVHINYVREYLITVKLQLLDYNRNSNTESSVSNNNARTNNDDERIHTGKLGGNKPKRTVKYVKRS